MDHDTQVLAEADWIIEMGPEAGADGGRVIAEGTVSELAENPNSQIGPFLSGRQIRRTSVAKCRERKPTSGKKTRQERWLFSQGDNSSFHRGDPYGKAPGD